MHTGWQVCNYTLNNLRRNHFKNPQNLTLQQANTQVSTYDQHTDTGTPSGDSPWNWLPACGCVKYREQSSLQEQV